MQGNIREKAFIIGAFAKLVNRVNSPHSGDIAENNLVRSNTHDGTICLEELLNRFALTEANDVDVKPDVGDGSIPRTGYCAKRGQEEVICDLDQHVCECGGGKAEE